MFELRINLGNAAMSSPEDIAYALRDIANRVETTGQSFGAVIDNNGNTVGEWEIN